MTTTEQSNWRSRDTVPLFHERDVCAASVLGISRAAAYNAAMAGEIPTIRLGRRLVVSTTVLRRMLAEVGPIEAVDTDRPMSVAG